MPVLLFWGALFDRCSVADPAEFLETTREMVPQSPLEAIFLSVSNLGSVCVWAQRFGACCYWHR